MTSQCRSFWLTSKGFAALGLIAAASYFLLVEHRQHVLQWLPFLIVALCPLMHIFMHRNHGNHGDAERCEGRRGRVGDGEQNQHREG